VYAQPLDSVPRPSPVTARMSQQEKLFDPRVLAIPVGSRVEFPNDDLIFHNVFSLSDPAPFDLGLYRAGDSRNVVFTRPGTYRVFCNIHPHMTAIILVLETGYIAEAGADGTFAIDVPPGRYRVTAWSERSEPASVDVDTRTGAGPVVGLELDESNYATISHTNKHGQTYRAPAYSAVGGFGRP